MLNDYSSTGFYTALDINPDLHMTLKPKDAVYRFKKLPRAVFTEFDSTSILEYKFDHNSTFFFFTLLFIHSFKT